MVRHEHDGRYGSGAAGRNAHYKQAAIHFNVPFSSLYNNIKRTKAAEEASESYEAALAESL